MSVGLTIFIVLFAIVGTILAIVMPFVVYYRRKNAAAALQQQAQPLADASIVDVPCPNCSAVNKVQAGQERQCEYCRSVLPG